MEVRGCRMGVRVAVGGVDGGDGVYGGVVGEDAL